MKHAIHRVESFEVVAPYTLRVTFDDKTQQLINFQSVFVDPEVHTLVWPNGADFDPATLHDWSQHVEALQAQASHWTSVAA